MSDSLWPHGLYSPWNSPGQNSRVGSLFPGIEPRSPTLQVASLQAEPQRKSKNTGVGSLSFLQWIFPTQESNQGLLKCRQILYLLSYQGSPSKQTGKASILVYVVGERLIQNNTLIHNLIRQWYRNWIGNDWIAVLFWIWSQKEYHLNWDLNRQRKKGFWGKLDPKPGVNLVSSKQNICIHTVMKQNDEA